MGNATLVFNRPEHATKVVDVLSGILIDKKPLRVELLVSAASNVAQPQASLADRVT